MVRRTEYLQKLLSWKDEQVIKVVTGIRRCGKSTLLKQYQALLRDQGVGEEQILSINFEELEYEPLLEYHALYDYVKAHLCPDKMTYIFLDEVQKVEGFQKVVDSLYVKENTDLYITGSNAYLLSGDLATLLTGRYVELSMLPLSFNEYCTITGVQGEAAFADYLKYGGLPYVKDIEDRQSRKESDPDKRKVTDITLLKTIARYLASVIGSQVSVKSVADYLTSNGRKVSPNTVDDYMEALSESFIFYPVERFDIVGKQLLKTNQKWYMVDLGLRGHILPRRSYDLGFSLENIVYFELRRRGFQVNIGKIGNGEVDFVAQKNSVITYVQVTADMTAQETFEREMRPLRTIRDNYRKVVLTLDRFTPGNYEGIDVIPAIDWLQGE